VSHGFLWALRKSINKAVGHFWQPISVYKSPTRE
jgi:hypothetical protein